MKLNVTLNRVIAGSALALSLMATTAMAADPTEKWCSGVTIAAFPGGPQGGVFANNVYNGFRQAEMDLGATVTYYFSDWDSNRLLQPRLTALPPMVLPVRLPLARSLIKPLRRARSLPA